MNISLNWSLHFGHGKSPTCFRCSSTHYTKNWRSRRPSRHIRLGCAGRWGSHEGQAKVDVVAIWRSVFENIPFPVKPLNNTQQEIPSLHPRKCRDGGIGWSASRHHPYITIKQTDINHTLYFTSTIKPSSRSYPSKPFLKLLSTTNRYDKNEYKPYIDTRINIAHLIPRAYTLLEGTWHLTG